MTNVLNLATVTRKELKKDIAEAVLEGNVVSAKIRLSVLSEMIAEEGFESVDEINEFYAIQGLIRAQ